MLLDKGMMILAAIILVLYGLTVLVITLNTKQVLKAIQSPEIEYEFVPHFDVGGNDIDYYPENAGDIEKLKEKCNFLPGCKAFNTLGYMKFSNQITRKNPTFTEANQGVYLRK